MRRVKIVSLRRHALLPGRDADGFMATARALAAGWDEAGGEAVFTAEAIAGLQERWPVARQAAGTPRRPPPRDAVCRHRGDETGTVECPTCGGTVRLKVFGCGIHGSCTIARQARGHACCGSCPDYTA